MRVPYFIPLHQAVKIRSHQIIPVPGGASPPRTPPVFVIVSDIRDSEIQDRIRVLYSYLYLDMRGSYKIEAALTPHGVARDMRRLRPVACSISVLLFLFSPAL